LRKSKEVCAFENGLILRDFIQKLREKCFYFANNKCAIGLPYSSLRRSVLKIQQKLMSEAASTRGRVTHFQVVRNFTNSADAAFTTTTKPGGETIQQRHQVVDFLPSAVLGEANNFIVVKSSLGACQEKRQVPDNPFQSIL
jgi:hypothetical protein